MKTTSLLVLAAGVGETYATFGNFFGGFKGANPFNCPDNTDNSRCEERQRGGFDFTDLIPGSKNPFYGGFNFNGFECKNDQRNRRELSGECGPDKNSNPFFGHPTESFSIDEIEIIPEFTADFEFVYDMPNGSQCKHRSTCNAGGSVVKNTQCGGAKKVTVVFPKQNNKPKAKTTPPQTTAPEVPQTTVPEVPETTVPEVPETTVPEVPETTVPEVPETTVPEVPGTTVPEVPETTAPEASETTPDAVETTPEVPETSAVSSSSPEEPETTPSVPEEPETTAPPTVDTTVTTRLTTSTIFTTVVNTVTDCGPAVPNCPADQASTVIVTATIPLTTTICPVTETITRTQGQEPPSSSVVSNSPIQSTPVEPLPCPEVVPSCLNTWLFSVGCADNTDTACFCPDAAFVKNIFTCIYAYGQTETIVSEAIVFFQGICGGHVPENPAIVTGVDSITSVITEAPKPTVPAGYATVTVTVTTVVPCVTDGVTISGSSITTVIEQTAEIPNVGFQTNSNGNVNVVPTTPVAVVNPRRHRHPYRHFPFRPRCLQHWRCLPTSPVVVAGANKVASGLGLGFAAVAALALF
ncbi:unnamed protein product [Parascedosporium putredinis]|uniref:CFEM domain-containing protein n=1 Tax=Parascedosporium putredinis TaxID=1442378 RepID=A0A9P1M7W2_9PEZI|nr:unnamed protein product [Parascedosporium putredinis]CAI7988093.1 unnamed protein product [Parascedosporium putredinis]